MTMRLPGWMTPQSAITEAELKAGLRMVLRDGVATQIMGNLTTGAFLVAFALLLGASNFAIGLIAALQALTQALQIPAIYLVEATRNRKALMVFGLSASRIFWIAMALIPWLVPKSHQIQAMFVALFIDFALGTIAGLAWHSWMRDLIPDAILGRYMGKRMAISTGVGAVVTLAAGLGVDAFKASEFGINPLLIYSIYFATGGVIGLVSVYFIARTPEPIMEHRPHPNIWAPIREPFSDANFRRLLWFLGSWNFAVNLAAPFFTVYMLKRLDLSMSAIVAFSVLSQVVNVFFFRLWGKLADRFSNKSVLMEAGLMFISTFLAWPFVAQADQLWVVMGMLVLLHAFAGMSTAGVALCTGNIALKLAPRGKATTYLAVRSFVSGITATLAPLLGGFLGNWFESQRLGVTLTWTSLAQRTAWHVPALELQGLDFLFVLAFLLGLYSLHRLLAVEEGGEIQKSEIRAEFTDEFRKAVRDVSNVAGLKDLLVLPYSQLLRLIGERRARRREPADRAFKP